MKNITRNYIIEFLSTFGEVSGNSSSYGSIPNNIIHQDRIVRIAEKLAQIHVSGMKKPYMYDIDYVTHCFLRNLIELPTDIQVMLADILETKWKM